MAGIEKRFGVRLDAEREGDLQTMYGLLLESVIPRGEAPLAGNEADVVRSFKEALRISDEAAAATHLDVGRRLTRALAEGGSREASARERKVSRCRPLCRGRDALTQELLHVNICTVLRMHDISTLGHWSPCQRQVHKSQRDSS